MLGKYLLFVACLLGVFALLMAAIPSGFLLAGEMYNPSYHDVEVQEEFNANDMVVYDSTGKDNMTYPYRYLRTVIVRPNMKLDCLRIIIWRLDGDLNKLDLGHGKLFLLEFVQDLGSFHGGGGQQRRIVRSIRLMEILSVCILSRTLLKIIILMIPMLLGSMLEELLSPPHS